MQTFLLAALLLLPLILFWQLPSGVPSALVAALVALVTAVVAMRRRIDATLSWALAALLAAAAVASYLVGDAGASRVEGWVGLAAGLSMVVAAYAGRPWTATAAARDWGGLAHDPIFAQINRSLSVLWGAAVAAHGAAVLEGAGPLVQWAPIAVIGIGSAALPLMWARRALAERIRVADPYRWRSPLVRRPPEPVDVDVVVVGAGVGGLTAGALLARAGAKVAVFEQHDKPGGFCHNWEGTAWDGDRPLAFRFDAGVHDVSGCFEGGPVRTLLERLDLGGAIEWRRMDHAFVDADGRWDVPRGWDAYADALAARFPEDGPALRALLADVRAIHGSMYASARSRGGVPGMPRTVDGLLAYAHAHPLAVRWMDAPFAALLDHHRVSARPRPLLTGLSGYVTHRPESLRVRDYAPLLGYFLHGGHYPVGGSGVLAQALADSVRLDAGEVSLSTPVDGVLLTGSGAEVTGVRLRDGREVRAAAVVLNGDLIAFGRRMVAPDALAAGFRHALDELRPAASMFMVHLGIRGVLPPLPPVLHVLDGAGTIEIVMPSLVDPGAAPPDHHTIELMRLVPPEAAADWFEDPDATDPVGQRASAAYLERKARAGDAMIEVAARLVPGLRERIVFRRDASPVTFRRYGFTTNGAVYGIDGPLAQIPRRTPLRGLVLAGAMTHGPGIEPAMMSGAEAADALLPGLLARGRRLPATP